MTADPHSITIFALALLTLGAAVLAVLKQTGRPIALMACAAALLLCLQQAFFAYQLRHFDALLQALGSSAVAGLCQFHILHQMLLGSHHPQAPLS